MAGERKRSLDLIEGYRVCRQRGVHSIAWLLCANFGSNVRSLPEVVGDAAVLVNPENVFDIARGIREVLTDENLRAETDLQRP